MKKFLLAWAVLLLAVSPAVAQEGAAEKSEKQAEKQQDQELSPAKQLAKYEKEAGKIIRDLGAKSSELRMKAMQGGDQEEVAAAMKKLTAEMEKGVGEPLGKALELAMKSEDPKFAVSSVKSILGFPIGSELRKKCFDFVIEKYADSKHITKIFDAFSGSLPSKATEDFLNAVVKKSTDKEVKAKAELARIGYYQFILQIKPMFESNPQAASAYPDLPVYFKSLEEKLSEESFIKQYKLIAEKYGDVKYRGSTVAKHVEKSLKVIEIRARVKVGKVAPDIEGPDMDGTSFKLSDYRGKVVMLDFWGDW